MDEQLTGHESGEEAAAEESRLAERLIRKEFGEPASVLDETAPVPVVTSPASGETAVVSGAAIHEEFAEPAPPAKSRSHRTGMLAGLGVVGALLAVLVVLSPGSGQPRLPAQSVHDVGPIAASGPKTAAATAPAAAVPPTTTSSAPSTSTPATPHKSETVPTTVTYVYLPGTTTPTETPTTSAPAPTATTSPPPPPTTTTTSPPTTTTTAKHCILGLIC
jgi:hypothetical protein